LNSGYKTKAELISWRRNKIIELKSQGLSQEEIAKILQVSPSTVTCDLNYLSQEAIENISEYTTKQYPIWFKTCIVAIQNSMKLYWDMAQNTQDNKEKVMALEHYRQSWMDMLSLIDWRGEMTLNNTVNRLNKYRYNGNGNGNCNGGSVRELVPKQEQEHEPQG